MNFQNAIMGGYSEQQILDYILTNIPQFGNKLKKAQSMGYSTSSIMDFIKNLSPIDLQNIGNNPEFNTGNPYIDADKINMANIKKQKKNIAKGVGLAVAPFALNALIGDATLGSIGKFGEKVGTKVKEALTRKTPKSLFRQLVGDIDITQLDEQSSKALSNYSRLAQQLEDKGKTLKDPVVKKLKRKIQNLLKGLGGIEAEAMAMQQPVAQNQFPGAMQMLQGEQQLMQSMQRGIEILKKLQGG